MRHLLSARSFCCAPDAQFCSVCPVRSVALPSFRCTPLSPLHTFVLIRIVYSVAFRPPRLPLSSNCAFLYPYDSPRLASLAEVSSSVPLQSSLSSSDDYICRRYFSALEQPAVLELNIARSQNSISPDRPGRSSTSRSTAGSNLNVCSVPFLW